MNSLETNEQLRSENRQIIRRLEKLESMLSVYGVPDIIQVDPIHLLRVRDTAIQPGR